MRARAGLAALLLAHAAAAEPARPKSVDPLTLFYQARVQGGLAVAATCINFNDPTDGGPNGGVLEVAGIPPGAEVQGAFLYWSVLSIASPVPAGTPTWEGMPIGAVSVGELMDTPCYTNQGEKSFTGIFRADVTAHVAGDGAYQVGGFVGTGRVDGDITEGATLFVVYCAPGGVETDVVLFEGIDITRPSFSQAITGFEAAPTEPVAATLAMAAGNGQARPLDPIEEDTDPVYFNGVDLDARDRSILSGGLCRDPVVVEHGLYDRTVIDVTGLIPAGSTSAALSIVVPAGDCHDVGAVALAVATVPGGALTEPSALDQRPSATPLRVARAGGDLAITWEDVGAPTYDLYRGAIGAWYSHGETGACALASPSATLPLPPGNAYLLAASVGCGGPSSLGRDSFARERPSALAASGRPCP